MGRAGGTRHEGHPETTLSHVAGLRVPAPPLLPSACSSALGSLHRCGVPVLPGLGRDTAVLSYALWGCFCCLTREAEQV